MGLVARVWPDETFREETAGVITFLAAQAPEALRTMKAHYVAAERLPFKEYLELETERHGRLVASEGFREASRAFVEKRAPVFAPR